jgi:adenine-specific DNA-methyltransferase
MNCIDYMKTLKDESVDLVFSDPPFNVNLKYNTYNDKRDDYYEWCADWIREGFRILKPTGSFYLMTAQNNLGEMIMEMKKYGIQQNIIVWKNTSMPSKKKYSVAYQPILFFTRSKEFTYKHDADGQVTNAALPYGKKPKSFTMRDLWDDIKFIAGGCMASKEAILLPGTKKKYHKAQMPLALANRIISASSNEGDIVYDMFSGSGTFLAKAKELNRKWVGTEIDSEYVKNVIKPRLK